MLCTSGFVADVNILVFSHNRPYSVSCVSLNGNFLDSYQISLNDRDQQLLIVDCAPRANSVFHKVLVIVK